MELSIRLDSGAAHRLFDRAPHVFDAALFAATEDGVTDLHVQMQTYPPQRAGTKYKRRNNLRESWLNRVRRRAGGVLGEVISSNMVAPYNRYVQSAEQQAYMHRGIWTNTDRAVMERSTQRINGYYRQRIERAASSLR